MERSFSQRRSRDRLVRDGHYSLHAIAQMESERKLTDMDNLKEIGQTWIVEFPRTKHLPFRPNATRDDLIATQVQASIIFDPAVVVSTTEKVDGAQLGVGIVDGNLCIRNRNHVLNKGYLSRGAAGRQFAPTWTYFYKRIEALKAMEKFAGEPLVIYGEWLYAVHSIVYDTLTVPFLSYDIYLPEQKIFIKGALARSLLENFGWSVVEQLENKGSYEELSKLCHQKSAYGSTKREGVYLSVCADKKSVTHRFKMVRSDFITGEHWSKRSIIKQPMVRF